MDAKVKNLEDVMTMITDRNISNVRFEFLDLNAIARSKTIPARHFKTTAKAGVMFPAPIFACNANSNIAFKSLIIEKYGFSDMVFYPDLSTFQVLPWVEDTARVYVSAPINEGVDKISVDPRNIALTQIENLKKKDLNIFSSFEHEFWVVHEMSREPIINTLHIFSTLRLSKQQAFIDKVAKNLFKAGVDIECFETEYAKGQFEMTICPTFGIQAADNAATFRTGVKEMAMQHGFVASFMSKPYADEEGSSGHLNHSLWSLDGKTPKTGDPSRPYGLSEIGEHWMAGLLEHAPALSFLQSPTLSCRERIKPGSFAPFNATWGVDNRTCAIRLKKIGAYGIYLENRLGSSAGNPYISLAATIAAGIDGIDRKLPLPSPVPTNKSSNDDTCIAYTPALLPRDMESAFQALKADTVIYQAIGVEFIDALEEAKRLDMETCANSDLDKFQLYRDLYFDYV